MAQQQQPQVIYVQQAPQPQMQVQAQASSAPEPVKQSPPVKRELDQQDSWAVFTKMTIIICCLIMVAEFRENANDINFEETEPTEECHFRVQLKWDFCAAAFSLNPMFGPAVPVLLKMGGLHGARLVDKGEVWRLFSSMYLHGGIVHLAMNMLALLAVGRALERAHGFFRTSTIYLLSGLFGGVASATFAPQTLSVGASGAIFGLIGALLGDILFNWDTLYSPCKSLVQLLLVSVFQLLLGTTPMLDNYAHFFGFAMGLACSFALLRRLNKGQHCCFTCSRRIIRSLSMLLVISGFAGGLGVMYGFSGADAHELCPQCTKISCFPFPWGCDEKECWWSCDHVASQLTCHGQASYVGSEQNGTISINCPERHAPVIVEAVDVSAWDEDLLGQMCRDHCV